MKPLNWKSIVSLVLLTCLLAVPVSAFGKKGKAHFDRGMKHEEAQQWDKAAQEFTLALAADPSNVEYQLHYRRATFNASQMFMQQGRALAEQRDYVGAYNAFRQAFGYDPVNQLAVSEMERMLRLEQVKQGNAMDATGDTAPRNGTLDSGGTPSQPAPAKSPEPQIVSPKLEVQRVINFSGDLKQFIRNYAEDLDLNVIFDRQTFAQPRTIDVHLRDVTTAKALDYVFLQEGLFFQKLDRRTILVADQSRRAQYQQLVVRTFYLGNAKPTKAKEVIAQALPASVGRPQPITVIDEDTNSLTVRDTAENVRLIGELLQGIDKDRAEVVMDVDIYEVSRTSMLQLGNQVGSTSVFNLGGSPGLAVVTDAARRIGQPNGVNLSNIVGTSPTGWAAALVLPPSVLTAFQSKSNARLLASTKVHAFNNEESQARIGQRVPVQTAQAYPFGVQTGQPNQTTNNLFPTGGFPVINYEPTGLTLNFTPIVFPNLDVQVKMKINSKDIAAGATPLTPTFTEREITGTARVQNNRTMLLANVSQNVESSGRAGLPVLSGLPILGRLFSSPTRDNRQVDIVIAVTPRVLRAPAITPRDEEMRPSGTLQAPTTGSLEAMLRETEREEMIATARRLPKSPVIEVPAAQPAFEPATKADLAKGSGDGATVPAPAAVTATMNPTSQSPVQNVSAPVTEGNRTVASMQNDNGIPQPKPATISAQEVATPKTTDVETALKSIVSSPTDVAATRLVAKENNGSDATIEVSPKPITVKSSAREPGVVELSLSPENGELKVGEKRQLAVLVKSTAPLGTALITLRFDPKILKVGAVSAGSLFANAKATPTLTHSVDENGMMLVSLTPAAGSATIADGALLNVEVEALAAGDSVLTFDLSNIHLVASDGRALLLQIEPVKLVVK